jgi:hypothetical protein
MRANYNPAVNFSLFWMDLLKANPGFTAADTVNSDTTGEHIGMSLVLNMAAPAAEVSTLAPDGVAAQTGYANASTANIANILGDPDTPGGTGFTAN